MKKLKLALLFTALSAPSLVSAQTYLSSTGKFLTEALALLNTTIIPIVFVLAMLFFFWGIANYIRKEGHEKDEAKKVMLWGVIALFVMVSVWGLVEVIRGELNLSVGSPARIPGFVKP
jgi:NADH:ubiquinone oxidoreductase subunit 2 (subunit N)